MKLDIQLVTAAVLSVGGLVLLFCGAFIAPQGEVHESILVGFGEVATFAGALFGIDYVYKRKEIKMKTENEEKDWVKVLYEVILKILTLGFYHVEKHRK